jgi:hypothetical protein
MPRPPSGSGPTGVTGAVTTLTADDFAFLRGIEAAIDRALEGHRAGETFVYGIHQEMPVDVPRALADRYRSAGWSEVTVKPGETGGHTVVMIP